MPARRAVKAFTAAVVGALALAAWCEAAEPRINHVEPQGVRRGAETVVKVFGARVGDSPQELMLYDDGVEVASLEAIDGKTLAATLRVSEGCRLGRHAVRVRTATGVSNLVTLHVGALEPVAEAEPNNALDTAQPLPLNRTVHGVVKAGDADFFAIDAPPGRRVSIEVEGLRLGRTFFDPEVALLDASGAVIAASDDQPSAHADAFLTAAAPKSGKLVVRLRESALRGNDRASYLLHVGEFPRPVAVFPPVAARGAEQPVRWIGGGPSAPQTLAIPANAGDTFEAFAEDEAGVAPTPLTLSVSDTAPTLEAEPNDGRRKATAMACPGVAAGVIQSDGDVDHFRIRAEAKQKLDLRVRARELRTELDPVLRVFDANGKRLAGNDDDRGNPDPYIRFVAPADGEYVLRVEDRLRRGGEAFAYCLDVARPRPVVDIRLNDRRRFEATVIEVPRGGRTAALLTVTRREFGGPLDLAFNRLPPGVGFECSTLAANYNLVPVVFEANADAELASSLSPVEASPAETGGGAMVESRFSQQTWLVRGRNNRAVWSHFAERVAVGVTEPLPFRVSLAQPKAPLCKNGSTELRVTAERDEGFDKPIAVRMLYHSPGVSSNRSRKIEAGKTAATIPVTANGKARTGEWDVVVIGEANVNGRVYASTEFVTLRVAEAYFDVGVPRVTVRQGGSAELVATLAHREPFDGAARLELVGLPPGVRSTPIDVAAGDASAAFQLQADADAKPGVHRGVGCRVRLTVDGETVAYRHAYSDLQVDPAEAPPEAQTARRADQGVAR